MIIVTGGAGFIGSNIVKMLNERGRKDIIVVDNLSQGIKFKNIADCHILDYYDKEDFIKFVRQGKKFSETVEIIFHQGACSSTTEWDGRFMMHNNYDYSKQLLHYCLDNHCQYIYASSASVYGNGTVFKEELCDENPVNMYAYSKFQFDQYVRRFIPKAQTQIVGLRYFNVYGPREQHKGPMSSTAFHFNQQVLENGKVRLFEGSDGYQNGEQRRDFIYVDDAVNVNLWFMENADKSGLFNVGTGQSRCFNDMAKAVIAWHGYGEIEYIPFPKNLIGCYQSFTEADISALRLIGYDKPFLTLEEGIKKYLNYLNR